MKLVHLDLESQFDSQENINTLVIENPVQFTKICTELFQQINGESGNFVLSDGDKILSLAQSADIVFDFFNLTLNSRKVLTKLNKSLSELVDEKMTEEIADVVALLFNFFDKLNAESEFPLSHKEECGATDLLKALDVKLLDNSNSLLEKIISYVNVSAGLSQTKLICFVNLKNYLTKRELQELFDFIKYNEVAVLLIEQNHKIKIDGEKVLIIDDDFCEILV